MQPLALGKKPVLERRLLDGESLQEVALIECGGVGERRRGALRHMLLELDDVDCYGAGSRDTVLPSVRRGSPSARCRLLRNA